MNTGIHFTAAHVLSLKYTAYIYMCWAALKFDTLNGTEKWPDVIYKNISTPFHRLPDFHAQRLAHVATYIEYSMCVYHIQYVHI
jgi:hypothetical protein